MSMSTTIIEPRVGAGPFRFGMTRDQAWSETRSVVRSSFPQEWSTERTDVFQSLAIHADYEGGVIVRLVAFTSSRPYVNRSVLSVFDQALGPEADRGDVVALLELQELPYVEGRERIDVPDLGLTFGFVEQGENDDERLGWISVEVAGRKQPFTRGAADAG
jgi:hypothetical protein